MKNNLISKYGLVGALGTAIILVISAYTALNSGSTFEDYSLIVIIATFILLLSELRKDVEELSFKQAYKNTFLAGVIMTIFSSIVYYLVIKYYNRNILDMLKIQINEAVNDKEFPFKISDMQKESFKSLGPLPFAISFLMFSVLKISFWAFIVSQFLKKDKMKYSDEQPY